MTRVIGLMSGTSLDGVDAALIETDGESIGALGPSLTVSYDPPLRAELRALLDDAPTLAITDPRVLDATAKITRVHADTVAALAAPADLIGFHGQTLLHAPAKGRTWQIGDASLLARLTGLPVAHDFRSADVAAGGNGAPLAPLFHAALTSALPKPVAVVNIGGVANVTWIGDTLLACDVGPGNGPLDDWTARHLGQPLDLDGRLAARGTADQGVLARVLADPFFARPAPKSLDRLYFGALLAAAGLDALSPADGAATLTALVAAGIAAAPVPVSPRRWIICGGGRNNPQILRALRSALAAPVATAEAIGWNGGAIEAQAFGFLAARVSRGLPLSLPETTGVPRPMPGGQLTYP